MIVRAVNSNLSILLKQFPAVGLIGPRQSGKTTIAQALQKELKKDSVYFDLESPADFRRFSDPELFLSQHQDACVIIDEVQRLPKLFPILRSLIDKKRKPGRFLLLGSASPDLVRDASESLAGRIYYMEAHPFNLTELPAKNTTLQKHWYRGGFPNAFLAKNDSAHFFWMDGFVRTFVERDLNSLFGVNFSPQLMFRLWRMIAHHHGGIWNAQSFAKGLDVSPTTVNRYLDYLEGSFMVRKLQPYFVNTRKRLLKTPKVYLRDSGLLHYLLDIHNAKALKYHSAVGLSWEGYAMEQIIQLLPRTLHPYYYRTHDGSEMDLVLLKGLKPAACVEIKYSLSPTVSRGMMESIKDLKSKNNFAIIPGDAAAYPLNRDIKVCGLIHFLREELPKLMK